MLELIRIPFILLDVFAPPASVADASLAGFGGGGASFAPLLGEYIGLDLLEV
jgi:hypothetical protein